MTSLLLIDLLHARDNHQERFISNFISRESVRPSRHSVFSYSESEDLDIDSPIVTTSPADSDEDCSECESDDEPEGGKTQDPTTNGEEDTQDTGDDLISCTV